MSSSFLSFSVKDCRNIDSPIDCRKMYNPLTQSLAFVIILTAVAAGYLIIISLPSTKALADNTDPTQEMRITAGAPIQSVPSSDAITSSSSSTSPRPTIQAALSHPSTSQSNNIVNTRATYGITFRTSTAGVIKTITMDFPAGFNVAAWTTLENARIGDGSLAASGQTLTYTVTNPVNIPAQTKIRIEVGNILNSATAGASSQVTVTTKDLTGNVIDGPTPTTAFFLKRIGTGDIGDNAITNSKIADNAVTAAKLSPDAVQQNLGPWMYLTFDTCSGTNGNHDVTCNVHDETNSITQLTCTVANPAVSGGDNVGNCTTNNSKHLLCTIPPQPGVFGCNLQS
jgi:hypothetical protein